VTGLDANILLRFLFKDDPVQSPQAQRLVSLLSPNKPGWVALTTILELAWVMKKTRRAGRDEIAGTIEAILTEDVIMVEQSATVAGAVRLFRKTRADFADCVVAESARAAGCDRTLTFDRIAGGDLGMELLA
jgi:predicted nucleic-acid-binding protein